MLLLATGILGHLGTLLAHVQPGTEQYLQIRFFYTVFQPLCSRLVVLPGVAVAKMQDLGLGVVELHPIGLSPPIQPVQIPL